MAAHASTRDARLAGAVYAAVAFCVAPSGLSAQEGCALGEGSELYRQESLPSGGTISYFTAPHFECADDVEIWADSAVAYSELGMSHLMGAVRYIDRTRELQADTARYFTNQGRLQAAGHVFIRDEDDGSEVRNGDLVYLRQTDFRETETMTVTTGRDGLRPVALIVPAAPESAPPDATPPEPYAVVGDRIFLRGDSYFAATGTVEIEQDSLLAFADSAEYDEVGANLLLDGSARVLSKGNELVGRSISVGTPGADTSRIRALDEAVLTGDGIVLTSPQILLFLMDGGLERLVATPLEIEDLDGAADSPPDSAVVAQPIATLDNAELTGDSLDIFAPNEIVERVVAVGSARSVSTARDSLNSEDLPEVATTDWLEGDTVVVTFRAPEADSSVADSSIAGDESDDGSEIESVVAKGGASALYRLAPSDSTAQVGIDPPALHYVVGDEITIMMADGDVEGMRVVGQTQGVHLEPLAPQPVADSVADSASVVIDTTAIRTDTTSAQPTMGSTWRPALERPGMPRQRSRTLREEPWRRE